MNPEISPNANQDNKGRSFGRKLIPRFTEGADGAQISSAQDMNVLVDGINCALSIKIEEGDRLEAIVTDANIVIKVPPQQQLSPVTAGTSSAIGALDQAIYAARSPTPYIYAVRGGFVYRCDANSGIVLATKRFTYPCFPDASICWDSVNDKILVSFWNEERGDDQATAEPYIAKGVYKLNADTLAVEASRVIDTNDTDCFSGPHQLFFESNRFFLLYHHEGGTSFFKELNPVTLATINSTASFSGPSWDDGAIDTVNGLFWCASAFGQELSSTDLATFGPRTTYDPNAIIALPGAGIVSTLSLILDDTIQNFSGGPWVPGYYIGAYVSGVCSVVISGTTYYFATYSAPTAVIDKVFNGVRGGDAAVGHGTLFTTLLDAHNDAASAGSSVLGNWVSSPATAPIGLASKNFGSSGTWSVSTAYTPGQQVYYNDGTVKAIYAAQTSTTGDTPAASYDPTRTYTAGQVVSFVGTLYTALATTTGDQPNVSPSKWSAGGAVIWNPLYTVVEDYSFTLNQVYIFTTPARTNVPYGCCYAPVSGDPKGTIFSSCRTQYLIAYNIDAAGFIQIDLGDPDFYPYRCRYNPNDGFVYVPGYKSPKIIRVDPILMTVHDTITGFDTVFDTFFPNGTDRWAVQQSAVGLKKY